MPLIIGRTSGGDYTPHPPGQFSAVCVDVADLGLQTSHYANGTKKQHKGALYFFCGQWKVDDQGQPVTPPVPLLIRARFTLTLHEKGNLRPFLEAWRGREFSDEELDIFDLESVIGARAFIQAVQVTKGDRKYTNITTIMKLPPGFPKVSIPEGYVRIKDRPDPHQEQTGKELRAAAPQSAPQQQPSPGAVTLPQPTPASQPNGPQAVRPQMQPADLGMQEKRPQPQPVPPQGGLADYDDDDLPF